RLLLWWLEVVKIGKMVAVDGGAWWRCRLGVAAAVGDGAAVVNGRNGGTGCDSGGD
nr:hypothetical protein [Tanacetum cinerariifolium]